MPHKQSQRIAVIYCAVLEVEIVHFARDIRNVIHTELLPQGLHQEPDKLRKTVQEAIDRIEAQLHPTAIVLGYGLCSRGTEGVTTKSAVLVVPRAHDCITVLLGSRKTYAAYVAAHPGTYWYSPGWNKHVLMPGKERYEKLYDEYVEKYGKEDGEYLMEAEQHWFRAYDRATYVDLGVGATPEDVDRTRQCAEWLNWTFDRHPGDPALLEDMLRGNWDDDRFLVLEPGQTLEMTIDEDVIRAAIPPGASSETEKTQ